MVSSWLVVRGAGVVVIVAAIYFVAVAVAVLMLLRRCPYKKFFSALFCCFHFLVKNPSQVENMYFPFLR